MADRCAAKPHDRKKLHYEHDGLNATQLRDAHHHSHQPGAVTDPVCGMAVNVTTDAPRSEYQGDAYFFCSPRCKTKFDAEPARYTKPLHGGEPEPAPAGVKWT